MKWPIGALAVAGIAAGTAAARRKPAEPDRWLGVTVNLPPDEVERDPRLREAFAELAEDAETRVRPAPGGHGTELAARPRRPAGSGLSGAARRLAGRDPRQPVRSALRDVKSLLETGEVLRTDPPTTGKPTPGGLVLRLATRRAGGEGRL
ncbi:hypothetical protein [Amycolatopsis rifamycinica]|uniref:Uncharacterized protein n=1 Tax=Amycolatopsis rifamycinica TaxID=287986 RepID=A0A066U4U2_9PSEU|nr:hypothetical protein [Amycolatopsis rifamycinica]KDN22486.1 hypothetical protein DV20_09535 [Amycolatopsis rifamycinica]